jgi:hypothetical protein
MRIALQWKHAVNYTAATPNPVIVHARLFTPRTGRDPAELHASDRRPALRLGRWTAPVRHPMLESPITLSLRKSDAHG